MKLKEGSKAYQERRKEGISGRKQRMKIGRKEGLPEGRK